MRRADNRAGSAVVTVVVVGAVILAAAACGLLAALALSRGAQQAAAQPSTEGAAQDLSAVTRFVDFGDVAVNLSEGRLTRYLKVKITLQVPKEAAPAVSEQMENGQKAVFTNWLIGYLSDRRLDEVQGASSINRLRREIQDGFNAILAENGAERIESVLFTEFYIQ